MKTIIHVNQHVIRANSKNGEENPVLTCKTYKENRYAKQVEVLDVEGRVVAKIIYSPNKPLSCGARVWIETENEINIIEKSPNSVEILTNLVMLVVVMVVSLYFEFRRENHNGTNNNIGDNLERQI